MALTTPGLGAFGQPQGLLKRSSFGAGALLLDKQARLDLALYYAYCRAVDDCADDFAPAQARRHLQAWRKELNALHAGRPTSPLGRALAEMLLRRNIPAGFLDDLWDGMLGDAAPKVGFKAWAELHRYCYRVAGSVGLACLPIFGLDLEKAGRYALALGEGLQLINILRDVREDLGRGRVYFALDDLKAVGLDRKNFMADPSSARAQRLYHHYAWRARAALRTADQEALSLDRRGLGPSRIMRAVYGDLLERMVRQGFGDRPTRPVLPTWAKWRALGRALLT